MNAALEAEGWGPVIKILCRKAGPVCDCGSYAYRARRIPQTAAQDLERPLLAVRCEKCGHVRGVDMLHPGTTVDLSGSVPAVVFQDSLF